MDAKDWPTPKSKRKERKCSYCREPGHDRRTCDVLMLHCAKFARVNRTFLHLIQDDLKERGIGAGALVEYVQMVDGKRKSTAIAVITNLNWDMLFFRRPGKRWIDARVLESSAVIKGSYGFTPSPIWHLRLPYHELQKEWCETGAKRLSLASSFSYTLTRIIVYLLLICFAIHYRTDQIICQVLSRVFYRSLVLWCFFRRSVADPPKSLFLLAFL